MKKCTKENGCDGKVGLGNNLAEAIVYAERLKKKFGKEYGIYRCPHCGGTHLTTKLFKQAEYPPLLYVTREGER